MVLFTPGEEAAAGYTGYLGNETITGLYAQEIKGAVILIERKSLLAPLAELEPNVLTRQ